MKAFLLREKLGINEKFNMMRLSAGKQQENPNFIISV